MAKTITTACPCGKGDYATCCKPYHDGTPAPTAEALMRSRYSAFVLDKLPYLLASWHPSTRPESLEPNPSDLKWLGLTIKQARDQDADHATVEFVARSRQAGRAHRMHEISRFVREGGQWYYVDGDLN